MTYTIDNAMPANIFRAYDVRGIVDESLTENGVYSIGVALGNDAQSKNVSEFVIARDGRLSGERLLAALASGLQAAGCDVTDIGMVPTPLLYYATQLTPGKSGVMLTGSHNPVNYNGLKIMVAGEICAEAHLQQIYQAIKHNRCRQTEKHGVLKTASVIESYLQKFTANIQITEPLTIVIDAGSGVTGMLAPQLFRALGCKVHELFCEVDGHFPHHHPDPSDPKNLQMLIAEVQKQNADVGIAFDGDGDRLGIVTNAGEIINPDRLLMLFARALLQTERDAKIIYDVKCSNHLHALVTQCGGEPIMWKTGHSLIKAKLAETNALLAGEMSGHFFFKDRWYGFDDALYAAARLLEILALENISSHALFADIPNSINTPELKISVTDEEKFNLMQQLIDRVNFVDAEEIHTIDGLRVSFKEGWGLVRPSNTTPYLILRFEALNDVIMEKIQQVFREWLLSVKPDLVLPF